ncbi:hypothetical protein [Streptomyces sp. NPDC050704]|uniref:hypothetical protein n=1 Tax=Streptomyces sp. NPDC050704 TaxID=3157219 RepID=UPI00341F9EFB
MKIAADTSSLVQPYAATTPVTLALVSAFPLAGRVRGGGAETVELRVIGYFDMLPSLPAPTRSAGPGSPGVTAPERYEPIFVVEPVGRVSPPGRSQYREA